MEPRQAGPSIRNYCPYRWSSALIAFAEDRLQDDKGDKGMTFICQPCPAGRFQASAGMVSCDPCPKGEYQGSWESDSKGPPSKDIPVLG